MPQHHSPGLGDDEGGWYPLRLKLPGRFTPEMVHGELMSRLPLKTPDRPGALLRETGERHAAFEPLMEPVDARGLPDARRTPRGPEVQEGDSACDVLAEVDGLPVQGLDLPVKGHHVA